MTRISEALAQRLEARLVPPPPHQKRTSVLVVWLPLLPPSVNHMYRAVPRRRSAAKGGGTYMGKELTPEALAFRTEVIVNVRRQAADEGFVLPSGPLALDVFVTFASKRAQDADNRIKAAQDAVAQALGFDDSRIIEGMRAVAGVEANRPATEMILRAARPFAVIRADMTRLLGENDVSSK